MIVKDEEEVLKNCLDSIKKIVDEIIIVDTGSTDNTKNIAYKYTHKVYDFIWENDFSKARNYAISKATKDYILWLDADDYLNKESINRFKTLKSNINDEIDIYYFLYEFNQNYEPFYRERLFKNNGKFKFVGKVHEVIIPSGNIKYEDIKIYQMEKNNKDISRNLKIYESMKKEEFSLRDFYYYGKELYRNKKYNKAYFVLKKLLNNNNLYVEDAIDACLTISNIFIIQNDYSKALKYLFLSFNYDLPRINVLTEIGNCYYNTNKIEKAIYYYELALKQKSNSKCFILKDYLGYYPAIMLCLCYDKLKDYKKANEYNELANTYKKNTISYRNNKKYFQRLLK